MPFVAAKWNKTKMRGRKPKPTAVQIAEGDPRKKGVRKLQKKLDSEPKAQRGLGECPPYLTGHARQAWDDLKEQLEIMGLDFKCDERTLGRMCAQFATSVRASEHIDAEGEVILQPVTSRSGELLGHRQVKNRWVSIRAEADKIFKQFCSDFGLSPVSRTRLTIDNQGDEEADLLKLLSGRRTPRKTEAVQ